MRVHSLIVAIVVVLMGMVLAIPAQAYPAMPPGVQGPFTVIKVVDGDPIWVDNGGRVKIRMIGLDTPAHADGGWVAAAGPYANYPQSRWSWDPQS